MTCRIRNGYSFGAAAGTTDEMVSRLQEIGARHAPLTNRASLFGWDPWHAACRAAGLIPHFGVELAVSPDTAEKRPLTDHFTFLAQDRLAPIHHLLATATNQPHGQPMLSYEQVNAARDMTVIAGHRALLDRLDPRPTLYVAASPAATPAYLRAALARGIPPVAACDNLFPRQADEGFYQVVIGQPRPGGRRTLPYTTQTYPLHLMGDEEWHDAMAARGHDNATCDTALANRDRVCDASTAKLGNAVMLTPDKPASLRQLCLDGAARLHLDLKDPRYGGRLDRELALIDEKQFENYFYVVADLMQWARRSMTVGPGRGSSGCSLVCYLLGITAIDPIAYDLVFERFIDVSRGGWRFPKEWPGFSGAPA